MILIINGEIHDLNVPQEKMHEILKRWREKVPNGIYALQKQFSKKKVHGMGVELVRMEFDNRARLDEMVAYHRMWGYKVHYSWEGVDWHDIEKVYPGKKSKGYGK